MITLSRLNRGEALRYMGVHALSADYMTNELMDKAEQDILKVARPAYTFTEIDINSPVLGGNDIASLLKDCEKIVVIVGTLGIYVDKLMRKTQVTDMAMAVVIDALASVAVEQLMDKIEDELRVRYKGYSFTNRFSPGYGDYPLCKQKEIVKLLNTEKKLGLSLTDSLMLNPSKSVTAVIGLGKDINVENKGCISKCSSCNKKDCLYRRAQ